MSDDKVDWRYLTPEQFTAQEREMFGTASERYHAAPKKLQMSDADYAAMDARVNAFVTGDVDRRRAENDARIRRDVQAELARRAAERAQNDG